MNNILMYKMPNNMNPPKRQVIKNILSLKNFEIKALSDTVVL